MTDSTPLPVVPATRPVSEGGRRLLDVLLKSGGMSQAAITRALDLAQPTVTRLVQGFVQDGMVVVSSRQVDRPGHPSTQITLNPDFAYGLGVSMMGDVLSMSLMDFAGRLRGERQLAMTQMRREAVLERIVAMKAELVSEADVDIRRIVGAGVGFSGFFVGEGKAFNPPATLDDWALVEIGPILEQALHMPVFVDNDGHVAAVAESLLGIGRRCQNFAYFHLTNGFGGGLIVDGRSFRGRYGNAAEFGGIWARLGGPYPGLDLLRECVGGRGLAFATVEEMVQTIDVSSPGVDDWLEIAEAPFSLLADIVTYTVDPELIVIGGRLPHSIAATLAERMSMSRVGYRRDRPPPVPKVVAAEVMSNPVSAGAAAMPLREAFFG